RVRLPVRTPFLLAVANPDTLNQEADPTNNVASVGFVPDHPGLVQWVVPSPNFEDRGANRVNQLILHAFGGRYNLSIARLTDPDDPAKPAPNYTTERDAPVPQLVPEGKRPNQAGPPAPNANLTSIGIEMEDRGLHDTADTSWMTDRLMDAVVELSRVLV